MSLASTPNIAISGQTGSPAHKSKRTKAHHEYAERKPRPSTVKPPVPLPSVNVAKAYKVAKERQKKRLAPPKKAVVSKPDQSEKKPQNDTFVTNTPLGRIRRTRRNNCASQPFAKPHKPTQFEVVDTPQPVFLIEIDPDAMQIDAHAAERHDMMMVPEYAEEIFAVMKCQEVCFGVFVNSRYAVLTSCVVYNRMSHVLLRATLKVVSNLI